MSRANKPWADRDITVLKEAVADGLTASDVAARLGKSRASCCGQARRMGLKWQSRALMAANPAKPKTPKPNAPITQPQRGGAGHAAWSEQAEAILRAGIDDGFTALGISRRLAAAGFYYNRAAVTSKAARSGLKFARTAGSGRLKAGDQGFATPTQIEAKVQRLTGARHLSPPNAAIMDAQAVAIFTRAETRLRGDDAVRLEDLGDKDCHGPKITAAGDTLYCGAVATVFRRRQAYCAACHGLMFQPVAPLRLGRQYG